MNAFSEGQIRSVERIGMGGDWPLAEFFKDKVTPMRRVMDRFAEPLLAQAQQNRLSAPSEKNVSANDEDNTLLAHLVKHTQGALCHFFLETGYVVLINGHRFHGS